MFFIVKWTEWTLSVVTPWWQLCKYYPHLGIIIIIIIISISIIIIIIIIIITKQQGTN